MYRSRSKGRLPQHLWVLVLKCLGMLTNLLRFSSHGKNGPCLLECSHNMKARSKDLQANLCANLLLRVVWTRPESTPVRNEQHEHRKPFASFLKRLQAPRQRLRNPPLVGSFPFSWFANVEFLQVKQICSILAPLRAAFDRFRVAFRVSSTQAWENTEQILLFLFRADFCWATPTVVAVHLSKRCQSIALVCVIDPLGYVVFAPLRQFLNQRRRLFFIRQELKAEWSGGSYREGRLWLFSLSLYTLTFAAGASSSWMSLHSWPVCQMMHDMKWKQTASRAASQLQLWSCAKRLRTSCTVLGTVLTSGEGCGVLCMLDQAFRFGLAIEKHSSQQRWAASYVLEPQSADVDF